VGPREVVLTVGGELGGGAALLRLATLYLLNQLQPDELKFGIRTYVRRGVYNIAATGENAARFMRLLAVSAPSAGGEYLSKKFNEFMKETRVEVRLDKDSIRRTKKGHVAADLTISEAGVAVKYNVYLHDAIVLEFVSTDRSRVELAARLLRLAGVSAEVKMKEGGRDEWRVEVTTDRLAAGREELRKALAELVNKAVERDWVDAGKAERWLEKLERGRVLKEGWPEYLMRLVEGALVVRFASPNPDSIKREAQRLREIGLVEGKHFTVKMPEEGRDGYVYIRREGLAYAAWLSVRGKDKQQRKLAADFVKYILERAEKEGDDVYEKVKEIIEEGMSRGSLKLEDFEMEVEVNGVKYKVKVRDGEAVEEDRGGKKLLRIRITAEVGGVRRDYTITYGRYYKNAAKGYATAKADDAERYSALIKALTGREPRLYRMKDGRIRIECYEGHLEGFMRYAELADAIARWLEETDR
jgi:Fe2+ transport system protein FeoA